MVDRRLKGPVQRVGPRCSGLGRVKARIAVSGLGEGLLKRAGLPAKLMAVPLS